MLYGLRPLVLAAFVAAPMSASADAFGARLYGNYCAKCHGDYGGGGTGGGFLGSTSGPPLNTLAARNGGTLPVDQITAYIGGSAATRGHASDMPNMKRDFEAFLRQGSNNASTESNAWIAAIVRHLDTLQVN